MDMKRTYALAYLTFLIAIQPALTYVRAGCQLSTHPVIAFNLLTSRISLHEPVYVEFVLSNNSADSISLDLGDNRQGAFQFITVVSHMNNQHQVTPFVTGPLTVSD